MNYTNLNQLLDNYLAEFERINDEPHTEYYKWEAVKHFRDHWDINAPDFSDMFKEAYRKTKNLIDNRSWPLSGIVALAQQPELRKTIPQLFKDLYQDDGADLSLRQARLEDFISRSNQLLHQYEPNKKGYKQNYQAVLFYLSFYKPAENYMIKSSPAWEFRDYIEFGEDFGFGQSFNLATYYRMCDEIVAVIKQREDVMAAHNNRLNDNMIRDDDYHILVYDIIYCVENYKLYKNISYVIPPKLSPTETKRRKLLAEKDREIEQVKQEMDSLISERAAYDMSSLVGMTLRHKSFGEGIVTQIEDGRIEVDFSDRQGSFVLPTAFSDGFLDSDSEEVEEMFRTMARLDDEIKQLKAEISRLELQRDRI